MGILAFVAGVLAVTLLLAWLWHAVEQWSSWP